MTFDPERVGLFARDDDPMPQETVRGFLIWLVCLDCGHRVGPLGFAGVMPRVADLLRVPMDHDCHPPA